jgi:hypothetical protein
VGVGWTRTSPDAPFYPIVCRISNFHDELGAPLPQARTEFVSQIHIARGPREDVLFATGQVGRQLLTALTRNLRRTVSRRLGPEPLTRLLAQGVRQAAKQNSTVGEGLLAVSLPKRAVEVQGDLTGIAVSGTPLPDMITFLYVPSGEYEGVSYGPNYACAGSAMFDFEVREIGEQDN